MIAKVIQPFSMSRFCSIWRIECEYEVDGNRVYLWEPLLPAVEVGADARPSWEYDHVTFYRPFQKDWVRCNRHLMFSRSASPDVVVLPSGLCVEMAGAQIVWREEHQRWFVRWHGWTNSRAAKLATEGLKAWREA